MYTVSVGYRKRLFMAWEKAVWYPPEISETELLKCIEEFFEE